MDSARLGAVWYGKMRSGMVIPLKEAGVVRSGEVRLGRVWCGKVGLGKVILSYVRGKCTEVICV